MTQRRLRYLKVSCLGGRYVCRHGSIESQHVCPCSLEAPQTPTRHMVQAHSGLHCPKTCPANLGDTTPMYLAAERAEKMKLSSLNTRRQLPLLSSTDFRVRQRHGLLQLQILHSARVAASFLSIAKKLPRLTSTQPRRLNILVFQVTPS